MTSDALNSLAEQLRRCRHLVVLTGAGISAESGVPTFRDAQTGLWSRYRPEELATPEAFAANPGLVWRWYEERRAALQQVAPNAGHRALAALSELVPQLTLITQNVDGLHQQAGSNDVVEFHGNISTTICSAAGCAGAPETAVEDEPPVCTECGSLCRPGVVWFGEAIPEDALARALAAAGDCDLFMAIGTSALVQPAAGLAQLAARAGARLAEINPEATPLSSAADVCITAPAGEMLPALVRLARCA